MSDLQKAREMVKAASRVAALTGAGVSAESGIPTFRGPGGLFEDTPAAELATPDAFADDPARVWRFYRWRRERVLQAEPNPAHRALASFQQGHGLCLITQNVDGLHQRAGADAVELHGCIMRSRCTGCRNRVDAKDEPEDEVPACPDCAHALRPDVVWFGESLNPAVLNEAGRGADACDVFLVLGTSAVVYPAAALPIQARQHGAQVIEVNPEETPLTQHSHVSLRGAAGEIVPRLLERSSRD